MLKRKHIDVPDSESNKNRKHRKCSRFEGVSGIAKPQKTKDRQGRSLSARLDRGRNELSNALKASRGPERQKLSRRRKTAEADSQIGEVERIDGEIAALGKINFDSLAETHLYKTLLRMKSVREHPTLPPWVRATQAEEMDTARTNVQARLFNARATKDAMEGIVVDVRAILGLDGHCKEREKQPANAQTGNNLFPNHDDGEERTDEEFTHITSRISSSQDEPEGVDSRVRSASRPCGPVRDLPPYSRETSSPPSPGLDRRSQNKENESKPTISQRSTFIPSLSAAGYISGSESEAECIKGHIAPPRKNRRGQRARQQLWEKRYGTHAKHIVKGEQRQNVRHDGWDTRRVAVKKLHREPSRGTRLEEKRNNRGDDTGKLHPSWEAAKLAKEKANFGNVQFQGKRITFD